MSRKDCVVDNGSRGPYLKPGWRSPIDRQARGKPEQPWALPGTGGALAPCAHVKRSVAYAFTLHRLRLGAMTRTAVRLSGQVGALAGLAGHRLALVEDPRRQLAVHVLAVAAIAQPHPARLARAGDVCALGEGHPSLAEPVPIDSALGPENVAPPAAVKDARILPTLAVALGHVAGASVRIAPFPRDGALRAEELRVDDDGGHRVRLGAAVHRALADRAARTGDEIVLPTDAGATGSRRKRTACAASTPRRVTGIVARVAGQNRRIPK